MIDSLINKAIATENPSTHSQSPELTGNTQHTLEKNDTLWKKMALTRKRMALTRQKTGIFFLKKNFTHKKNPALS